VLLAAPALAADKPVSLGVFLPTTMVEARSASSSGGLGAAMESRWAEMVVKNFGRYEDFAAAVGSGLDWSSSTRGRRRVAPPAEVIALGAVNGETYQRIGRSSHRSHGEGDGGKKLAVPRGAKSVESKFTAMRIFVGDIPEKH